ncbi:hypothetical protein ACFTZM_21130, partial [Streptomyces hydrogenans]
MPQTTVPDHRGRAERPEEPGRPDPADRADDSAGEPPRFPLPNTTPWRPSPGFATLREERPLCPVRLPTGSDAVLVTGYADNRALLADERFSRAAAARAGAPRARRIPLDATSLTTLDGAEHARLRSAVAGLKELLGEVVARRRAEPTDDVLGVLA